MEQKLKPSRKTKKEKWLLLLANKPEIPNLVKQNYTYCLA